MSHHLDSPLARQHVRLDITDPYVFRGDTGKNSVVLKPSDVFPYLAPSS